MQKKVLFLRLLVAEKKCEAYAYFLAKLFIAIPPSPSLPLVSMAAFTKVGLISF